ncbi:hypothetical protein D9M68_186190 [compost metagenome]
MAPDWAVTAVFEPMRAIVVSVSTVTATEPATAALLVETPPAAAIVVTSSVEMAETSRPAGPPVSTSAWPRISAFTSSM